MICEYCKSTDGEQSKYHPNTCVHCGAVMKPVYGYYFGKPITDIDNFIEIQKTHSMGYTFSMNSAYLKLLNSALGSGKQ